MTSQINFHTKSTFYVDEISFVRVTTNVQSVQAQAERQELTPKDPQRIALQGKSLKCVPMTDDQFRAAYQSSEYENNLQDIYFEVTLNREVDEPLAVELFQSFGPLIAVKFKNGVLTRRGI